MKAKRVMPNPLKQSVVAPRSRLMVKRRLSLLRRSALPKRRRKSMKMAKKLSQLRSLVPRRPKRRKMKI
jgi:hypothetical protein